jgi:hypothetical protein
MTKEILMESVRDYLQNNLSNVRIPQKSIRVMTSQRATPECGEEFIGVYGTDVTNQSGPNSLSKLLEHTLNIGITRRVSGLPNEQTGENILTEDQVAKYAPSMLERARQIINLLDNNFGLFATINTTACSLDGGGFIQPLGFVSMDSAPEQVGEEHFDVQRDFTNARYVGLFLEIRFGGAVYVKINRPSGTY